jgi:hypothetical protein
MKRSPTEQTKVKELPAGGQPAKREAPAARPRSMARPSLRSLLLPAEHGAWGFLAEPLVLGLWIAPTIAAGWLGLAVLQLFFLHQPLKWALKDGLRGKFYARTRWAAGLVVALGLGAAGALSLAIRYGEQPFWLPLLLALPLGGWQLRYEIANRGRDLLPELAGALGLQLAAPALALAGGAPPAVAWGLAAVLAARTVPSILYVRARLRLERGEPANRAEALYSHTLALLLIGLAAIAGWIPWLAAAAVGLLWLRALHGLSSFRRPAPAKVIGIGELLYGLFVVVATALGYRLGW